MFGKNCKKIKLTENLGESVSFGGGVGMFHIPNRNL